MRFSIHDGDKSKKLFGKKLIFVACALAVVLFLVLVSLQFWSQPSGETSLARLSVHENMMVRNYDQKKGGNSFSGDDPVQSGFRVCNQTSSHVGIALGYKKQDVWMSEGWWNLPPQRCEKLLAGHLVSRYYYLYAVDYDQGGEWKGETLLCLDEASFTIEGFHACEQRGYQAHGFFEIDTGALSSWTVRLTEESSAPL
jgi:uncharacterized membrane protein